MTEKSILTQEFDKPMNKHTKANLLVRMEKLLRYDGDDFDSTAFKANFKDCQQLYKQLERANE